MNRTMGLRWALALIGATGTAGASTCGRLEYALAGDGSLSVVVSDGGPKGFTLRFRREGT